jgi:hypothetical protein
LALERILRDLLQRLAATPCCTPWQSRRNAYMSDKPACPGVLCA